MPGALSRVLCISPARCWLCATEHHVLVAVGVFPSSLVAYRRSSAPPCRTTRCGVPTPHGCCVPQIFPRNPQAAESHPKVASVLKRSYGVVLACGTAPSPSFSVFEKGQVHILSLLSLGLVLPRRRSTQSKLRCSCARRFPWSGSRGSPICRQMPWLEHQEGIDSLDVVAALVPGCFRDHRVWPRPLS